MENLVATSGSSLVQKLVNDGFDPLMGAYAAIMGQYISRGGLEEFGDDGCPLCRIDAKHAGFAAEWIACSVTDQLEIARNKKLTPMVQ